MEPYRTVSYVTLRFIPSTGTVLRSTHHRVGLYLQNYEYFRALIAEIQDPRALGFIALIMMLWVGAVCPVGEDCDGTTTKKICLASSFAKAGAGDCTACPKDHSSLPGR